MSEMNNCFKEAVCVEVQRVFDSCSDRDCIYELPVTLTPDSPPITDDMDFVRTRCAEVEATCISVDSVPFKSGYYAVDITYRFKITVEAFSKGFCKPQTGVLLCGTALWNKRVILYGGEGNAKVFTSEQELNPTPIGECDSSFACCCNCGASMPKASVHVVDPIALDTKLICVPGSGVNPGPCPPQRPSKPNCPCDCPPPMPPHIPGPEPSFHRVVAVSLGLFSIVQLSRPVSIIVPAYDYCMPCKDCSFSETSESPCDVFDRIDFPCEQFFPQPSADAAKYGCGCSMNGSNNSNQSDNCSCNDSGYDNSCDCCDNNSYDRNYNYRR